MLRCTTWLSPGLPLGLFELVARELGAGLGVAVDLSSRTDASGPQPGDDPFARGDVDVGFMCAPSFRRLTSVALLAAPVFADPRNGHAPVYFSELVVCDGTAESLADLRGKRVGCNDSESLSGYAALVERLARAAIDVDLVHTGGHRVSLEMLARGEIDAAAVDSNTLLNLDLWPDGLRVVETWGPYPVQPVVARRSLGEAVRAAMTGVLLAMPDEGLRTYAVERFVEVSSAHYDVVH